MKKKHVHVQAQAHACTESISENQVDKSKKPFICFQIFSNIPYLSSDAEQSTSNMFLPLYCEWCQLLKLEDWPRVLNCSLLTGSRTSLYQDAVHKMEYAFQ